ncbi:MAG: response regulator transcription factor [Actinomycetota bacterium]
MAVWALLSDRSPARVLPALDEVRPDLKVELLEVGSLEHVIAISPAAILVDAVENPGQAWSVLSALAAMEVRAPAVAIIERDALARYPWHEIVDDFLSPGATEAELLTRMALVRTRTGGAEGSTLHLGPLRIDMDAYRVSSGSRTLDLAFKEFELLRFLAQHPGRVHTRPALLRQVWGYDFYGGTRTVDVHVRRLRAKLGPEHEHLIETVRGVGYRAAETEG